MADHDLNGMIEDVGSGFSAKEAALMSLAASMKRIADVMCGSGDSASFLTHLGAVLADASHDHAQRMR